MKESKKTRIGKYLRVSDRERALYGYGLDSQGEKIDGYLKLFDYNEDNCEVSIYKDEGISAKNMNRAQLQVMLADVKKGKLDIIVISKLDRLARNVIDTYEIMRMLIECNCNLIAVMDHIDILSANGRMLVGILAIIAQWEREVIQERTIDGLAAMVSQGKYPYGRTPFGWEKDDDKFLLVHERNSNIINYLADLTLDGQNLSELKRMLLEEYKVKVDSGTIKKWLMKDYNVGIFHYHDRIYTNIVPAIMNKDKHEKVKQVLMKRSSKWDTKEYYYANMVYCSCGRLTSHKVTNKRNKKYRYYVCEDCGLRVNQDFIVEQTLNEIMMKKKVDQLNEVKKELMKRIVIINKKIENIYDQYITNVLSEKSYAFSLNKLKSEKEIYQEELKGVYISDTVKWMKGIDSSKKKFIQSVVSKVVVDLELKLVLRINYKGASKTK